MHIQGYKQSKAYIIAEGPMASTTRNMWKVVYDRKCGAIVMLSDLVESGMVRISTAYRMSWTMTNYNKGVFSTIKGSVICRGGCGLNRPCVTFRVYHDVETLQQITYMPV